MSGGDTIVATTDGAVGRLVLNVPERRNAISYAMRARLADAFAAFDEDPDVRVVVLTGAGSAFCAGVDLSDAGEPDASALAATTRPLTWPLECFGKPLLAAINGPATGGGFELALAADLRIASTAAWFALPEVKLGSLPGSGGTQRLTRALPTAIAAKLVLTGERLEANAALRYGLVSDLVAPDELLPLADAIAARIAANAPLSLRAAKLALRAAVEQPLADGLTLERTLWGMLSTTRDRQEGRAAFRERRPPHFTGE
ncbi:MAG TPA: enoyl-CoA hydratase/isomerase family protein [Gaiellaceae bacterium]